MRLDLIDKLEPSLYPSRSIHQKQIESWFGRRKLLRELTPQECELLAKTDLFFVVFTNRSGSTYLTEILHQMNAGVHPRAEMFNRLSVKKESREAGFKTFTDYFLSKITRHRRHARVGFKISASQLFWVTRLGLLTPFRSTRLINSLREDVVGQAVSHCKALASGQWHSLMPAKDASAVEYSPKKIVQSLSVISQNREWLNYYCALHNPDRLDVVYESVLEQPRVEIARMASFLGFEDFDPGSVDLGAVSIKQQRNEENQRLKQRFIDEFSLP